MDAASWGPWARVRSRCRLEPVALAAGLAVAGWAVLFGWLALARHLSGGSHAEDLGFTDQVIGNVLRGQWFRTTVYAGATWNTEIDLTHVARPDSLLAFHVEPMLLLFVPLYALGGDVQLLLVVQAVAVALGAISAYRLGQRWIGSRWAGAALAAVYLLSPLGQWAVLADFHTSTLATPLLLLAIEQFANGNARLGIGAAALALTAREDVGPVVACLGLLIALGFKRPRAGAVLGLLGLSWTVVCLLVIRAYSGGGMSPFASRYGAILDRGPGAAWDALTRSADLDYLLTLLLGGGWLGPFAPLTLLPGLPSLMLNLLSSSAWMASGRAHYSGLVLPFVVGAAAAAVGHPPLRRFARPVGAALVATSALGYLLAGAGPLAANYAPATLTEHARLADAIAASIPVADAVSASSPLVPHLSRRARVYVFPAVLDADDVFVDLTASPAPTSAGDVFLRLRDLLAAGGWSVIEARDGLLLLQRTAEAPPLSTDDLPPDLLSFVHIPTPASSATPPQGSADEPLSLVDARLVPSLDGAVEPDGPRWILKTSWTVARPLPSGARLELELGLQDGERRRAWDLAPLWWYPPERWTPGEVVTLDVRDVPVRRFGSWRPILSTL